MEDRHVLIARDGSVIGAVFDGHSGAAVAELGESWLPAMPDIPPGKALRAIHRASQSLHGGACSVAFRLMGERLEVANVGDAGLVRVSSGAAEVLTETHRLDNPAERARVIAAGAGIFEPYVIDPHTGDGVMSTRALGDHVFAHIGIIGEPYEWDGAFTGGWLVAACDGLWDVMTAKELPRWLSGTARESAEALAHEALEVRRTADNLTIIVVRPA
jgi:serine/threonine protein phosphatase PrpC